MNETHGHKCTKFTQSRFSRRRWIHMRKFWYDELKTMTEKVLSHQQQQQQTSIILIIISSEEWRERENKKKIVKTNRYLPVIGFDENRLHDTEDCRTGVNVPVKREWFLIGARVSINAMHTIFVSNTENDGQIKNTEILNSLWAHESIALCVYGKFTHLW